MVKISNEFAKIFPEHISRTNQIKLLGNVRITKEDKITEDTCKKGKSSLTLP